MTPREQELLSLIKTRGYWTIVVRPASFVQPRLKRLELFELVADARVELRGWDFPHVDRSAAPHIDVEWVGQTVEWEHVLEFWRMYRSGQFVSFGGLFSEWRDRSGWWPPGQGWSANTVLGVSETIARIAEVFEFASRLSQTKAGDDSMVVSIGLANMADRQLVLDSPRRGRLRASYRSDVKDIQVVRTLARTEIVSRARELGAECAEEVFSYFGWKPAPQILADIQKEVFDG